jgi:hypothetical protein
MYDYLTNGVYITRDASDTVFKARAPIKADVFDLKDVIKATKEHGLGRYDADSLILCRAAHRR